ncbi:hypothetical protein K432DRAFT_383540 [Lepidopterella palustris CBS 459.81]|uniref:RNA polymerase II subunit B1 CTD phosphatase RPAP2 homolog n=1 Tax=Lepidopterella palustris CBS 459.81 TaxID=1314670 RepID=A0A8E2JEB3_9PEZI|nr:hypothetical protein K432DRAFT_383540 [Lepidopterella palustris CBS 459.81]
MGPKSILKNSIPVSSSSPSAKPVNERHLEVALYHANLIKEQRDVEEQILKATLTLLDFPSAPGANPARPSIADALQFRTLIIPFQPSDYDSLIEERNIADLCGYALCPKPPKRAPLAGKLQFVDTKDGVQIVNKKELEVWCSEECARRALYVKVQLNEEPAWMRRGGIGDKIDILVENTEDHRIVLPLRPKHKESDANKDDGETNQDQEDEQEAWALREEAMAELAQERGDRNAKSTKKGLIKATIEERMTVKTPVAPSTEVQHGGAAHMAIEGHIPKADMPKKSVDGQDEDEEDNDWDD